MSAWTPACAGVTKTRGFSLVELSIVLVILGLLVGGVLAGQSLIRAAELRSVTADLQRYQTAINTFRNKYFAMPGDMTNATAFWGSAGGTGSDNTCFITNSADKRTCNGNGDGLTEVSGTDPTYGERFRAWQQLANAGLIEGSYTGVSESTTFDSRLPGKNMPASKLSSNGFGIAGLNAVVSGDANYFDRSYHWNILFLHGSIGSTITATEMWNIDTKLDDGKPAYGSVYTVKSTSAWGPGCATTDVVSTAEYNMTNTAKNCVLYFKLN